MSYHIRVLAGKVNRDAGSHVYHQELVKRLVARGHSVSLICFETGGDTIACNRVWQLSASSWAQSRLLWRFDAVLNHWHYTRAIFRKLQLTAADIVIGGEHLLLKGHVARFPTTPFIYLPHALVAPREIQSYGYPLIKRWSTSLLYWRLQRWALQRADRTVRFTQLGCRALAEYYGRRITPKFYVNPMGVDLPPLGRAPRPSRTVRLLAVGRLVPSKNLVFLLQVLSTLKQLPWHLTIVGDGPQRRELERWVAEQGLEGRVVFTGHQKDTSRWYTNADLLVFPSRLESCGMVILEAMSYGVPPLAIKANGRDYCNVAEELIEHGRTGFVARDEVAFRDSLTSVLREPGQLDHMGGVGRLTVAARHTWESHIDRYEHLFAQLVAPIQASVRF